MITLLPGLHASHYLSFQNFQNFSQLQFEGVELDFLEGHLQLRLGHRGHSLEHASSFGSLDLSVMGLRSLLVILSPLPGLDWQNEKETGLQTAR